jgi:hypothetical protein
MTISKRHAQAVIDQRYLDKLAVSWPGEGHDCVEVDAEVFDLMADPTKKRALFMYEHSIEEWFRHWRDHIPTDDCTLQEIAERYGIEWGDA